MPYLDVGLNKFGTLNCGYLITTLLLDSR